MSGAYPAYSEKGRMTRHLNTGPCSPRTREGATHPGGRHLRRALAKLAARRTRDNKAGSMKK